MPTEPVSQIQLPRNIGSIRHVAEWLREGCGQADPDCVAGLELALVEAVTNIVRHSGLEVRDEKIGVQLSLLPNAVEVIITHRGEPVSTDALKLSESALEFDPEDIANLPANGLGLAIIREATDEFDYRTIDGFNTIRLVKHLT